VREEAAYAIAELGVEGRSAKSLLLRAMLDGDPKVRAAAAEALGDLGLRGPEVVEAIQSALSVEADGWAGGKMSAALTALRTPS